MTSKPTLATSFLACVREPLRTRIAARGDVEQRLAAALSAARTAWPGLGVADEQFAAYLGARLPSDATADVAIERARTADLYLACACQTGDAAAIAAFESFCWSQVDAALGSMRLAESLTEEVKQALRARLFVGDPGHRPLLADYEGRGELAGWLRSVAVRAAVRQARGERRMISMDDESLDAATVASDDPELARIRERYAADFQAALAEALSALSRRERNLLRQHFLDGLTVDDLGKIYRVHRATAARWLAAAREAAVQGTRQALVARLGVGAAELDSLVRVVRAGLDVSVSRFFRR